MRLLSLILVLSTACVDDDVPAPGCQGSEELPDRGWFCPAGDDLAQWVDPMIGTSGSGNAIPGALVPHGMVKLSPDSVVDPGSVDGYE
jgi:hypothetical protein